MTADGPKVTLKQTKQRHRTRGKAIFLQAETVAVDNSSAYVSHTSTPSTSKISARGLNHHGVMAWPTLKELLDEPEEVTIDEYFGRLKNNLNFTRKQKKADPFLKTGKMMREILRRTHHDQPFANGHCLPKVFPRR